MLAIYLKENKDRNEFFFCLSQTNCLTKKHWDGFNLILKIIAKENSGKS